MSGFNLGDYIDVKERLKLFYDLYKDGSIQFEFKGLMPNNPDMIWGIAYAYRHPEDTKPATGHACELAIGKTTFTRGSELMNLETSAIGRAIGALGIGLGKSIATSNEIEYAKARNTEPEIKKNSDGQELMTDKQYRYIQSCFKGGFAEMSLYVDAFKQSYSLEADFKLTKEWASALIDTLHKDGHKPVKKTPLTDTESKD